MTPPVRFETLARLPSEAVIHFANFLAVVLLACAYSILLPAYAVLFGEARWLSGIVFSGSLATGFVLATVLWFRSLTRAPVVEEFPTDGGSAFRSVAQEEFGRISGPGAPIPRLFWSPTDVRVAARVAGRSINPMLIVSAGLVAKLQDTRDVVRFYLLHEFAHLQQADLELLTATQALHRAWLAITAVACVASAVLVAPALADPLLRGLLTFVSMLWIATLVVVAIALARYASVVVAFRELDADVRVLAWRPEMGTCLTDVFGSPAGRARRHSLRSLLSPLITHFSAAERLMFLQEPRRLLLPKFRYFASVAALLLWLQSSPFLAGYGYTPLRIALLAPWALACLAYCASTSRCTTGMAMEGIAPSPLCVAELAAPAVLLFLIPSLEVGDLFMGALAMMQADTATVVAGTEQLMRAVREIVSSPWSYVFTLLLALSIRLSAGVSAASAADALGIGGWASGTLCASALLSIERIQVEHVTRWDGMSTWLDANSMFSQSMGMVITLAVFGARHLWVRRPPSIRAQRPAG